MTYRIARNGQVYGPYSLTEVQRYIASGHVVATDLAQAEGEQEWLPVATVFPLAPVQSASHPGGLPALFRDPPDLPWWITLLLGIFTGGVFFVVWDLVESAWMRRVERSSMALWFYIASTIIFVIDLPSSYHSVDHALFNGPAIEAPHSALFGGVAFVIRLIARFVLRSDLLRHFNEPEPVGLRLSGFMTLLFGGLYFQYHFNRINEVKRALRVSVPRD